MGIFNFLKKKKENHEAMISSLPVEDPKSSTAEKNNNSEPSIMEELEDNKPLIISYSTGWPIDLVYGYLGKNYEKKGFEDSMVKNDLTFRDMNMNIIRNKILMVFREINVKYDMMKNDLEVRMANCKAAGLLTTISELDQSLNIINTHKKELKELEENFRNNGNNSSIPLQSYNCGFLRGIATIALSQGSSTPKMPADNISMYTHEKIA